MGLRNVKMHIKVIRQGWGAMGSGHVMVFAWPTSDDDYYVYKASKNHDKAIRGIKLDFGPESEAISFSNPKDEYKWQEGSNSVILDSETSFATFCEQLYASKFAHSRNYKPRTHNCVHAVMHALQIAGIDARIDSQEKEFKHLFCCLWYPTRIITPKDLISGLKHYKENTAAIESSISL